MNRQIQRFAGLLTAALMLTGTALPAAAGTVDEAESLEIRTYMLQDYDSEAHVTYGSGHYQEILLNGAAAERLPALQAALKDFDREYASAQTSSFSEACAEVRKSLADYDREYEVSLETAIYPRRADDQVFSFITYYSGYTGGAHGYYAWQGYNYDPATGNVLALMDIVSDEEALKDVIWELLLDKYAGGSIGTMGATIEDYGSGEGKTPLNWTAGADGLTFIFNPYELASYAEGAQFVTVGYEQYADLFTGRIGPLTGPGCCRLLGWVPEDVDLDGDGIPESVSISENRPDMSYVESFTLHVGEENCEIPISGFSGTPYLLRTSDGRILLYLEVLSENDYRQTAAAELTGGVPRYLGMLNAAMPVSWEDLVSVQLFPLDPECFLMQQRQNLLSTYSGEKLFTTAGGSWGEPLTEEWQVPYGPTLITARSLSARQVDPISGDVSDTVIKIPSGEELTVTATDGSSWVDFACRDGSTVRICVETGGYPHMIDGTDENACFETLYYAG